MYAVSYRATERGIQRNAAATRINEKRAAYETKQAEKARVHRITQEGAERARAYALELRVLGHRYRPTLAEIERRACRVFGVTRNEIRGHRRGRHVCFARQFIMYWAVRLTPLSTPQIGHLLGDRDHATIIHGSDVYPVKRDKMGRHLRKVR